MAEKKWAGTTFGSGAMHRWLIRLLRVIDVRAVYVFTFVCVIPVCVFLPGFRHSYRFFRRRMGDGRLKAFVRAYRNHCMFAESLRQSLQEPLHVRPGRHRQVRHVCRQELRHQHGGRRALQPSGLKAGELHDDEFAHRQLRDRGLLAALDAKGAPRAGLRRRERERDG